MRTIIKFFGEALVSKVLYLARNIRDVIQKVKVINIALIMSKEIKGEIVTGKGCGEIIRNVVKKDKTIKVAAEVYHETVVERRDKGSRSNIVIEIIIFNIC